MLRTIIFLVEPSFSLNKRIRTDQNLHTFNQTQTPNQTLQIFYLTLTEYSKVNIIFYVIFIYHLATIPQNY